MKIETAIERLEEMIDCWAFLASIDHEDPHGAELAQAALKERRTLTNDNPTPKTYTQAHVDLLEEVADVYVSLGELLSLADWEAVARIREEKEARWLRRLEERTEDEH